MENKIKVIIEIELHCEDKENLEMALTKTLTIPNKINKLIKKQNSSVFTNSIRVKDKYSVKTEHIN
jgi:hypothetical protein